MITLDHFNLIQFYHSLSENQQSDLHRTRTRKLIRTFLVFMNIYNSHSTIEKTTSVYCLVFGSWKYDKINHVIKKTKHAAVDRCMHIIDIVDLLIKTYLTCIQN